LENSFNKREKIKRIRVKLKKIKQKQFIEWWNWKKKNFNKSAEDKIKFFKKIRIKMKNQTYEKLQLKN
jgi:hypothetical protein